MKSSDWAWLVSLLMLTLGAATAGCAASGNWKVYPLIVGFLVAGIGGGQFVGLLLKKEK